MPISISVETNAQPLDDLIAYADSLQQISNEELRQAVNDVRSAFYSEIKEEPPKRSYPSDYPIEWTSDKQRKAYFASDGFGAGIPYQRTGRLAQSWQMLFTVQSGSGAVVVENPARAARYVYGSLATNPNAARRFQQRYHRITGWEFAKPIVDFWVDAVIEEWAQNLDKRIGEFVGSQNVSRRARTPRLSRRS